MGEEDLKRQMDYFCPYISRTVDLTEERERHICEYHPDLEPLFDRIGEVLTDPDQIRRSIYDEEVILFYKFWEDILSGKYIVVVVKTYLRDFVLTAYLTDKIKEGELLWEKD